MSIIRYIINKNDIIALLAISAKCGKINSDPIKLWIKIIKAYYGCKNNACCIFIYCLCLNNLIIQLKQLKLINDECNKKLKRLANELLYNKYKNDTCCIYYNEFSFESMTIIFECEHMICFSYWIDMWKINTFDNIHCPICREHINNTK